MVEETEQITTEQILVETESVETGQITTEQALQILESVEYVPLGHTLTIYSGDELFTVYLSVFGGALAAFAIVVVLMRVLGGESR